IFQWKKGVCLPSSAVLGRLSAALAVPRENLIARCAAGDDPHLRNPLTEWLRHLGLWGKDAHEKTVPPLVFRLTRSQLTLFLNRLFATDGWATVLAEGNGQIGYGTVSEQLARQVQHLLFRFGIIASLRRRSVLYKGTRRTSWQLDITDRDSIRTFAVEIG